MPAAWWQRRRARLAPRTHLRSTTARRRCSTGPSQSAGRTSQPTAASTATAHAATPRSCARRAAPPCSRPNRRPSPCFQCQLVRMLGREWTTAGVPMWSSSVPRWRRRQTGMSRGPGPRGQVGLTLVGGMVVAVATTMTGGWACAPPCRTPAPLQALLKAAERRRRQAGRAKAKEREECRTQNDRSSPPR